MQVKVSVILPSLNVASYIEECMESVINQTMKDIEIICVDAGSDDGTAEILEKYKNKDNRIKVLHSPKKSYGLQVNMGIDEAKGEYIGLVDTDDYVKEDMYETLYHHAKEMRADYVKGDFDVFVHSSTGERIFMPYRVSWGCSARYGRRFGKITISETMDTPDVFLWNGIYRREFLTDNGIRFNETPGASIQDCGVRYKIALCLDRGYYINRTVYCYRRDNVGASSYSSKLILHHLNEFRSVVDFANSKNDISDQQWSFLAREIAIITFRTYQDLLVWGEPAGETGEAMEAIRDIVREIDKKNVRTAKYMSPNAMLEANLFMDEKMCDGFARHRAKAVRDGLLFFLKELRSKQRVWILGIGIEADYAYLFLKNNGINNVVGFLDNNATGQGLSKYGLPVENSKDCIEREKDSYFLIATPDERIDDAKNWLVRNGVKRNHCKEYGRFFDQLLHPFVCTNILLKENL